jgi:hypothetical protein
MRFTALLLLILPSASAQVTTIDVNGNPIGSRPVLNFYSGPGIVQSCSDNPDKKRVDCSSAFNSALIATHDAVHSNENFCDSSNGSTLYTCRLPPKVLTQYTLGMTFLLRTDATCMAGCSLNIDGLGPKAIKQTDGSTDPSGALVAGQPQWVFFDGVVFRLLSAASARASSSSSSDERGDVRARRVIGAMDTMPYASSITVDVTAGDLHKTTTANSAGNATISASTAGLPGQHMWILIANDQIGAKTITFGSNIRSAGPFTGTPGKTATLQFVSDGIAWYEVTRTLGL